MRRTMKRNWILAAAVSLAFGATPLMAADNNVQNDHNGVPGVNADVSKDSASVNTKDNGASISTHDDANKDRNGVPGVDVDISHKNDAKNDTRAMAGDDRNDNGVPGVDVSRTNGNDRGVPGVDVDTSGNARAKVTDRRQERIDQGTVKDAMQQVRESEEVLAKMQKDPDLKAAMARAKGILISPDYGRAGLVLGAHGGNGVLLIHNGKQWTGPALYNLGGISIGAQAGASGGQRAMLLMTDKAINKFKQNNNFGLNADAGLTVVAWSAKAQARTGGDVIMWSDQIGAYAGATIGVTDVNFDERETASLYGHKVTAKQIIAGEVKPEENLGSIMKSLPVG